MKQTVGLKELCITAIANFSVLILSPYFMLCTFEPWSAACVRLRIIDRSQWTD